MVERLLANVGCLHCDSCPLLVDGMRVGGATGVVEPAVFVRAPQLGKKKTPSSEKKNDDSCVLRTSPAWGRTLNHVRLSSGRVTRNGVGTREQGRAERALRNGGAL